MSASTAALALVNGCLLAPPQTPAKVPRLGYVGFATRESIAEYIGALQDGLRQLGWVEGQNMAIEWRFADGRTELLAELVGGLVRLAVDVLLVTGSTQAAMVARQMTSTIPIVVFPAVYPVEAGLVSSLARPGANLTALSSTAPGLGAKELDLLRAVVPDLSRLAVLLNSTNLSYVAHWDEIRLAAQQSGVQVDRIELRSADDAEAAFESAAVSGAEAAYDDNTALVRTDPAFYAALALKHRLPYMTGNLDYVPAGLLMAYGANVPAIHRRAAVYIDKILKGANPGELPVEQPTVFDFVVNTKTAQTLGITFQPEIAAQVTHWVQ